MVRKGRFALPALVAVVTVTALAAPVDAQPGNLAIASTSDAGIKSNDSTSSLSAFIVSTSSDGTRVAFSSDATNLDPLDTDVTTDIYVKDLATGDLLLASTSTGGTKGNGASFSPSLSSDGTHVAFTSTSTNLDADDTDTLHDVYVKDLATGEITLVSTSPGGAKGNGLSFSSSLSSDGTRLAFVSTSTNLDPLDGDSLFDVYVRDLAGDSLILASTSDGGVKGNSHSGELGVKLSGDGSRVAFLSTSTNLDPADTDSIRDVFVKDLSSGDLLLASTSDGGDKSNGESSYLWLSLNGTRVAFGSVATNLDPGDSDPGPDLYVKDLATGDVILASTSSTGVKANHETGNFGTDISSDGTRVVVQSSATNLDPRDTDGVFDVYVKDLATGEMSLASTSDDGVKGNQTSGSSSISADGARVAFASFSSNLDPADTDTFLDVYVKELGEEPPSILCTITGTNGDDLLKGTRENDVICGLGGDDILLGGVDGDDLLLGGEGRDRLRGGSGEDILRGEAGDDSLDTRDNVSGNDTADGGDGFDRCRSDRGDVLIDCP